MIWLGLESCAHGLLKFPSQEFCRTSESKASPSTRTGVWALHLNFWFEGRSQIGSSLLDFRFPLSWLAYAWVSSPVSAGQADLHTLPFKKHFIVDLQCLISVVQQSDSVIHIVFSYSSPLWFIAGIQFPVLYGRTLLFIHLACNSLHLLTPDSESFRPLVTHPLGNHKSVLYVVSLFLLCWWIHLCHILDST